MRFQRHLVLLLASSTVVLAQMGGMPGGGMGSGPGNTTGSGGSTAPARNRMGSGMMNPATPSGAYMQMFQNMGGMPAMGSGMGAGMTDDMTVGPDGTAYVIRSIANPQPVGSTASAWQFELDAISPADGSVKWKLPISSGRVSNPVLASDGLIYVSVDNYQMFYANYTSGGTMMTAAQAQANDGQVLVISASNGS